MGNPERGLAELAGALRSWVWPWPNRQEPRDFWMPDDCVRVCYDCDGQFTLFNRRHHCRVCGRVFCNRCTANTVPASALGSNSRFGNADDAAAAETASRRSPAPDEGERIRACNYCYKLWKQELEAAVLAAAMADAERLRCSTPGLSPSHSTTSLGSTKSSCTVRSNSTRGTARLYNGRVYQHAGYGAGGHGGILPEKDKQDVQRKDAGSIEENEEEEEEDAGESSPNPYGYCSSRSEDEDDDYGGCHSDTEDRCFHQSNTYYNHVEFDEVNCDQPKKKTDGKDFPSHDEECMGEKALDVKGRTEAELDNIHDCDASSIYNTEEADVEPVDFENNGVLWFPPLPENEEDDQDASISDEEEDDDTASEFRYLRTSGSFDSGESRNRARTVEEHKKAMQNVLDGHFKALVSQLLQVENLQEGKDGDAESWLEIITSLSWEVASLLKPDTSSGGGMDPGGYAKIKCIASGHRSESSVLKGVVCRRNLAHRRMKSRIEKPRLLILGGALEYQRVSNLLSSFDTLLQQEMDHLKMAVTKIDAYHPDVLLVEKTVSRFAQDYLLAKDISLVLNIKRPLLERIARCTGSQIIPSIDHLSPQKLGYCDLFHVQKFVEEYGIASNSGTKQAKNLMFFEGCPKPLGCTVLLRGADRDELKRVKHVVQYAVFAAYHLALETSFLADEGASLPELPLRSPITVALPEKVSASAIGRSISMVSGFAFPNVNLVPNISRLDVSEDNNVSKFSSGLGGSSHIAKFSARPEGSCKDTTFSPGNLDENFGRHSVWEKHREDILRYSKEKNNEIDSEYSSLRSSSRTNNSDTCNIYPFWGRKTSEAPIGEKLLNVKQMQSLDFGKLLQDNDNSNTNQDEDQIPIDEFPPSPSNHQSILVSLSTRCVWKGTVCERAHLFRIKYYGSFDKPLGRFLRDHLFDQGYRCRMCEMPSEAHVHCYTHRQGSLTISVKKFPEEVLRGQRIGKIWMWHRCLRCPRRGGMPPETRRVIMSDAAWGLSFGKFLELSFSNHAAASRVASCGHSLHRDCLRFYGFGTMVACFRYASIDVNSVYLPPAQLDFNIQHEDWLQNELNKVVEKADLLFTEVLNGINHVAERINSVLPSSHLKSPDSKLGIVELRGIWQKEKAEFEETLSKLSDNSLIKGQPDLIEINKLHRKLFFHAYLWDRRLIFAAGFDNYNEGLGSMTLNKEKLTSLLEPGVINSLSRPQNTSSNLDSSSTENMDDAVNIEGTRPTGNEGEIPSPSNLVPSVDQEGGLPHGTDTGESHSHNLLMVNDDQDDSLHLDSAIQKALSVADISLVQALPDTLDAKWTGEDGSVPDLSQSDTVDPFENQNIATEPQNSDDVCYKTDVVQSNGFPTGEGKRDLSILVEMPFSKFYSAINKNHAGETPLFQILHEYNPVYISSFRELDRQGDAKVLLPLGIDGIFVPIFDDEPASIICHALVSFEYHSQMAEEQDRSKDGFDISTSLPASDSGSFNPLASLDEVITESLKSVYSVDDTMLSLLSSSSIQLDPVLCSKNLHIKVSFTDECSSGKMRYTVTCYYAKQFHSLRRICCPHELDFIKSLSRCKKWGAQGGKSNVFFAKSLDDRFVIKQVTKTELESFIKFAPRYFKYLSDSIGTKSPTCLAKILGIYQVSCKHLKGGKESKMDVLVMENLLFGRNISRLYDLKGSSRSRYNADSNGNNKVLLDQNLIESMPTSPIFVGNKAKRLLERAVWNDTSFLANIDVMDYSLLVGIDEEKHELVLGIIDFMRQYTWDKHLETWVKASGILGGPKNSDPTVISPKQYKKRFRKAMAAYFLMVPDQWSPPSVAPSRSHSDFGEEV